MVRIKRIFAHEILNTKGYPTIETIVELSDGVVTKSSAPSVSIHSTYEASELRDNNPTRYNGMGVLTAVDNVNNIIASKLIGMDVADQSKIDRLMIEMDGTQNKSRLGANTMLSVSQSVIKAAAKSALLPLSIYLRQFLSANSLKSTPRELGKKIPVPIFSLMEGGNSISNTLDFKEFLIIPASSKEYHDSLEMGVTIYHSLDNILRERGLSVLVADRGGYCPNVTSNKDAFSLMRESIDRAGYQFSLDVFLGVNIGGNLLKQYNMYSVSDKKTQFNQDELLNFYQELFSEFSLIYLEDPFSEDDWEAWRKAYSVLSRKLLLIGNDLVTTNPYRLQIAIDNNVISGINVKPIQIGTVSEALAVCEMARFKNLKIIVSGCAFETIDDFIADFSVAVGADYVKFGAPVHERIVKYNRLLEIAREIQTM